MQMMERKREKRRGPKTGSCPEIWRIGVARSNSLLAQRSAQKPKPVAGRDDANPACFTKLARYRWDRQAQPAVIALSIVPRHSAIYAASTIRRTQLHFEWPGDSHSGIGKLLWWQWTLSEAWKMPGQFNIENPDFLVSSPVDPIRGWRFPAFSSHSTTFRHDLAAARLLG